MALPNQNPAGIPVTRCQWQARWEEFAGWAAEQLGLVMEFTGVAYQLREKVEADQTVATEASSQSGLGASLKSRLTFGKPKDPADQTRVFSSAGALAEELLLRVSAHRPLPDLAPADQPERVHDLAAKLIHAYRMDGGRIHIAGCSFEDVPFFRVTTVDASGAEPVFWHSLLDQQGEVVDEATAEQLGLRETKQFEYHPTDYELPQALKPSGEPAESPRPGLCTAVVWAKRVTGNIQFSIGEESFHAPFSGWARTLAAQPVACPQTGVTAFHFAPLDNGAIAAADEIAECEHSHRRMLRGDLLTCAVTGQRVAPEYCEDCPVTGEPARSEFFANCPHCGQRVSRASLEGSLCLACRAVQPVGASDPRLIAILSVYPALKRLKGWRMADTRQVFLVRGRRGLRRYFFVLDRRDLSVLKAVRVTPWRGQRDLAESERSALFGDK